MQEITENGANKGKRNEYLVDNKDLVIALLKDNDKKVLQSEIYDELTEV